MEREIECLFLEVDVSGLFLDDDSLGLQYATVFAPDGGGHTSVEGHSVGDLTKLPLVQRTCPSCEVDADPCCVTYETVMEIRIKVILITSNTQCFVSLTLVDLLIIG